jgi:long-chain acyl-CoA synthetase
MGYLDEDGYLFLTDRKRDMIISGGVNIYPAEVEGVLCNHPKVVDCAVFGIPDEEFGETVAAAIQLLPGEAATEADVRAFLHGRLAGYKVPRHFDFRDQLPRDDAGKIRKREIRAPYWRDANRNI